MNLLFPQCSSEYLECSGYNVFPGGGTTLFQQYFAWARSKFNNSGDGKKVPYDACTDVPQPFHSVLGCLVKRRTKDLHPGRPNGARDEKALDVWVRMFIHRNRVIRNHHQRPDKEIIDLLLTII